MSTVKKIAIACDKSGFSLKEAVTGYLESRPDVSVVDMGLRHSEENEPYDRQAAKVAGAIRIGEAVLGILICGTGQGMAIVANKFKDVYAVVADTVFAGMKGRIINNANVLTMGGWITAPTLGVQIVETWLDSEFTVSMEERSEWLKAAYERVKKIEAENFKS